MAETKTRYKLDVRASASFKFQEMHLLVRFDVPLIQARSASECIFVFFVTHLLAPRACILGVSVSFRSILSSIFKRIGEMLHR